MAFNVAEIVSRLYGEAPINRFGEVLVAGWGMILGCVIFLATAMLGNPYLDRCRLRLLRLLYRQLHTSTVRGGRARGN